jgi:hypothetical protein
MKLREIDFSECKRKEKKVNFYTLLFSYKNILNLSYLYLKKQKMSAIITKAIITALKLEADLIIEKF